MKKLLFTSIFCVGALLSYSQDKKPVYEFKTAIDLSHTETKNQCMTGTCWSFATVSFLESELMRMDKGQHDLSEMFNVRMTYPKKVDKYVRMQGKYQFGPGSLSHDVINVLEGYGLVPESVYSGRENEKELYDHGQLDAVLVAVVDAVLENNPGNRAYVAAVEGILDAYIGEVPEKFTYEGKEYTPQSFKESMGLNASDYVSFTSYTHHPFYEEFILEVPDNFSQGEFMNVPVEDLVSIIDNALTEGYTIAWDADVSEKSFSFRNGIAIIPEDGIKKDQLWKEVVKEKKVTQEMRQETFDNFTTTDDHLMHLIGKATDQNGTTYYMIKNSWGDGNPYDGIQYISEEYIKLKTVGILLHKEGVPKAVRKKAGM
ncbi:MAG: C1 family peptidase [Flavobacteriales bacterium]